MKKRTACLVVIPLLVALGASAQVDVPTERHIDLDQLRASREQAAANTALSDALSAQVLGHYDAAIGSLEAAALNGVDAANSRAEQSNISRLVAALDEELKRPEEVPRLNLPTNPTVEQAEDALARERSRFAAHRTFLRDTERLAEERTTSRNEISQRLGILDQELERLRDELRVQVGRDTHPDLKDAARMRALARQEEVLSKINALRATTALLEDQGVLIPLEVDLAQRRVSLSEQMLIMLGEAAQRVRVKEAEASIERLRELCETVSERLPGLAAIAAETERLAVMLWGPSGVAVRAEENSRSLLLTRKNLADLNRIADLTRRKFEAFGDIGSLSRWWPDIPEDFPGPGAAAKAVGRLELLVPQAQHQLITLEQQRAAARDLLREVQAELRTHYGDEIDPEALRLGRELLVERREVLDQLNQAYGRYSNELVEHLTVSKHFLDRLNHVERFLYSQVIWSRSVPHPIVPRLRDMGHALAWLFSPFSRTPEGQSRPLLHTRNIDIAVVLIVGMLLLVRRRLESRRGALADRVESPEQDSLRLTLAALLQSILLAAPLPLILYHGGVVLARSDGSIYAAAAAAALTYCSIIAALFELTRQLVAPRGLAEVHFGWPTTVTRELHRGLLWTEIFSLPLFFVALLFAMAGARLDSPQSLQVFNNSLGRVAFILALGVVGFSALVGLRPERKFGHDDDKPLLSRRLSDYAFPTSVVYAVPLLILSTLVPAAFAAFGFYVTSLLLAYQMLRTLWMGLAVLIAGGLLNRWRATGGLKSARIGDAQSETDPDGHEATMAERQARQLLRFLVALALAFGLFTIWSDALPMLQDLKRLQIWPRITMMERVSHQQPIIGAAQAEAPAATSVAEEGASTAVTAGMPVPQPPPASTAEATTVLTLWALLEAILAGLITFLLARNLPGLVEILLKRRTAFDSGARFAFSTLIRYAVTILGVSMVFNLLGISWSKIQWLAAALTFGLGFGLQEIVANFVSGLILLIERPVRVGDVVTIGNLMGKVKRIQIRATTITLWDRSEMIVPNKEFITTKLVNWTLSDSKRRIEIPLQVAYGTDLERVKDILSSCASEHTNVLPDPTPYAVLLEFGEHGVQVELRFVVDFGKGLTTKDEVQMAIERAFREHGIDFAPPRLSVDLPRVDEDGESKLRT